jgi:hypothetical protein
MYHLGGIHRSDPSAVMQSSQPASQISRISKLTTHDKGQQQRTRRPCGILEAEYPVVETSKMEGSRVVSSPYLLTPNVPKH